MYRTEHGLALSGCFPTWTAVITTYCALAFKLSQTQQPHTLPGSGGSVQQFINGSGSYIILPGRLFPCLYSHLQRHTLTIVSLFPIGSFYRNTWLFCHWRLSQACSKHIKEILKVLFIGKVTNSVELFLKHCFTCFLW